MVPWDALRAVRPMRAPTPYVITEDDVLVPLRAARPTAVVARDVPPGVLAGGSLALCTVDTGRLLPAYLAWYLNHPVTGLALDRMTQGSNLQFVPLSALRAMKVVLPPLPVQRHIARAAGLHARAEALEQQLAGARAALVSALTLNALRHANVRRA